MKRHIRLTFVGSALVSVLLQIPLTLVLMRWAGRWLGLALVVGFNGLQAFRYVSTALRRRRLPRWVAALDSSYFAWVFAAAIFAVVYAVLVGVCGAIGPRLPGAAAWMMAYFPSVLAVVCLGTVGFAAFTRHMRMTVRNLEVEVAGLPAAFDGYRILQMSDIHIGPQVPPERVERWVRKANRLEPDLVALTGDYIASGTDYHDDVARVLGQLRAKDGVFASMGNHDYLGDGEAMARLLDQAGLVVLRNRGTVIAKGRDRLYVAGVDDTWTQLDDVAAAMEGRPENVPSVLLAHDPDLLDEAAEHDVDLMLSGHTHGGQIGLPGLAKQINFSRPITRLTAGFYRRGRTLLYVNRGVGTTFMPLRFGVPPELAVVTLRAA